MDATALQTRSRTTAGITVSIVALTLTGCVVWKSDYDKVELENQQLKSQLAQSQAEQTFVEAGDLLFPPGGYLLSPAGQTELKKNIVPRLKGYQNVKIVVYGYTDNAPVGPQLQQQGISDNLVLSRRASTPTSFRPRASATRIRPRRTIRHRAGPRTAASKSPCKDLAPPLLLQGDFRRNVARVRYSCFGNSGH